MKENTKPIRKLDELFALRKVVIRMLQSGKKRHAIIHVTGLTYEGIKTAEALFKQGGMAALKPKARGPVAGVGYVLTQEQERQIQKVLINKLPEQMKLDFALWNREAVRDAIRLLLGIDMPVRTVGDYLKRWGFTPQKPIRRAYEQRPEAVKKWLEESYPQIAKRAKAEKAEIHWGDETALHCGDVGGRSYSPRGKPPVAYKHGGSWKKLSMLATVTNQGKMRWMVTDKSFDADKLIEFMGRLIEDSDRKIYLILDNLRVHHSQKVKEWAEKMKEKIELYYLPSYSPELNPEELLNASLKHEVRKRAPTRTSERLRKVTEQHMNMLSNAPEKVKSFFQHPYVKYAA